jgi:hypothetical protein
MPLQGCDKAFSAGIRASFNPSKAAASAASQMEESMLKYLSICAALSVLGANPVQAQQREAVLHRMEVPGVGFDIVVALPKARGVTYDLAETPDALLMHLNGGLAVAFESAESMLQALDLVQRPACAAEVASRDGMSLMPVAVYLVPTME